MIRNHNKKRYAYFLFIQLFCLFSLSIEVTSQTVTENHNLGVSFYDSLRVRADKNKFTRLLYDFLIVTADSSESTKSRLSSTKPFDQYEGMIIRNSQIIRVNAFGSDVDNPIYYNPSRAEKILNSTYIKTRRFVLQKYLIFKNGEKLSSLTLSDNERLLREIPFVEDARIIVVPVSETEVDIMVVVRESYPLGFDLSFKQISMGKASFFDRNFAGIGHEFEIIFPFDFKHYSYPGIGATYSIKNIWHTFSNLTIDLSDGLGKTTAGVSIIRPFVSSETKYSWYANISRTYTSEDLDTMAVPEPVRYSYQDYWFARSFLVDRSSVTRFIFSARYINNNVYNKPEITSNSYYPLQKYKLIVGSVAFSSQKFLNTALIYGYGRTEDIPYGYLLEADGGFEDNEFKKRSYVGFEAAYGNYYDKFGYIYLGTGFSTFYNQGQTEQGLFQARLRYFTPLLRLGEYKMRNFINISYIRGFNRYTNEFLYYNTSSLIRGFTSDSIRGDHRLITSFEPVIFTPKPLMGFRFAFYAFADAGITINGSLSEGSKTRIYAIGGGVRIRNDQLLFNTLQIRIGYYPVIPDYSRASWLDVSGLTRLRPPNFEPGPPAVIPYQ